VLPLPHWRSEWSRHGALPPGGAGITDFALLGECHSHIICHCTLNSKVEVMNQIP